MAPVIKALRRHGIQAPILATAQHRGMLDQMMQSFGLQSDWDLDVMRPDQSLSELTGRLVPAIEGILRQTTPSAVLAQGDTTTVFCSALASFFARIPFGHVEAGLRSNDLSSPFPEEGMRRLSAVLARWHFAPTTQAAEALRSESVAGDTIHVVGNTVIDSVLETAAIEDLPWPVGLPIDIEEKRIVLVTLHRRESFGLPMRNILKALRQFAERHNDAAIVYPVHPNPNVRGPVIEHLSGLANVHLLEPLAYPALVHLMKKCSMIFTDSGGLQEEGPALGKPVIVFRDVTERPEGVIAGGVQLVGTDPERIHAIVERLWNDSEVYQAMAVPRFPFGDGHASEQIAGILADQL
jgi:UDP-N-acetylglucosamine 2-epimerase (non-hydrolysing)